MRDRRRNVLLVVVKKLSFPSSTSRCVEHYFVICSAVFIVLLSKSERVPDGAQPCLLTGGHSRRAVPQMDSLCVGEKEPAIKGLTGFSSLLVCLMKL